MASKSFFSNTTNVALTVAAVALLVLGMYLLYLQLNPVVTAVIEAEKEGKITMQVVSCNDQNPTKAPLTEQKLKPGVNYVRVHPTGVPKFIQFKRPTSVGPPPAVNLKELNLSKLSSKVDLLKGATVMVMPLLVTDSNPPQTLAADVLPIPIMAVRTTEVHVNESIHGC